ncbi:MAG: hypothetical protein AABX23_04565 [Nanoarchaeota archaeon]
MVRRNPQITYKQNAVRGKLFEFILRDWIEQAGFDLNAQVGQMTQSKTKKRLHGRGGTYDPDFIGEFPITLPFSYPFLLVGEAKNYSTPIQIKQVREFLGAFIDISQYSRINTKSRSRTKYSQIFDEKRYSYIPVFYSTSGFAKNAQALMWSHGIYFVSYENFQIIEDLRKRMNSLTKEINYKELTKQQVWNIKTLDDFDKLPSNVTKDNYKTAMEKLKKLIKPINSYFGILDNLWPIHFLTKGKVKINPTMKQKEVIYVKNENQVTLKRSLNLRSQNWGFFSLPKYFIEEYQKIAKKQNKQILQEVILFIKKEKKIFPLYVKLKAKGE